MSVTWPHPVAVASKIVSTSLGSCKGVDIVWLGLPYIGDGKSDPIPDKWPGMVDALKCVSKDVKKNKLQGKAYVVMPTGFLGPKGSVFVVTKKMIKSLEEAVKKVRDLDVLLIMSAGNSLSEESDESLSITTYPQLLGKTDARVVVVGGVSTDGKAWKDSLTAPWVKINAVSKATNTISEIKGGNHWGRVARDGTSFSEYLFRTGIGSNTSDHDNRCANDSWSLGLPAYDRCQIQ